MWNHRNSTAERPVRKNNNAANARALAAVLLLSASHPAMAGAGNTHIKNKVKKTPMLQVYRKPVLQLTTQRIQGLKLNPQSASRQKHQRQNFPS